MSDKDIIREFQNWRKKHRFNLTEVAHLVDRTRAWASQVEQGRIRKLKKSTREAIEWLMRMEQ